MISLQQGNMLVISSSFSQNRIHLPFNFKFLFIFLVTTCPITAIEIISIGSACNVARAARHNNLRTTAYPFDWMITSLQALKAGFQDDFAHVLMPEQVRENEDKKSVIDGYGLIYIHDFPTVRNPITPEDGEIMPVHELARNWRDSISLVHAKFNRRLQRLLDLLRNGIPVALVRYNEMNKSDAEQFIELVKQKFPHAKAVLVVIGNTPEFKESWNIPHVCNLYIDPKDFSAWDGPAWAEAMLKIAALNPQGWQLSERNSYLLTLPIYNPGMFSVFNTVIGALDYYDRGNISGLRIDFETNGWYYDPIRGNNWWNYYFEPIALGDYTSKEEQLFPTYQKIDFAYKAQFEMPRERAHELIEKYIHVLPHIATSVDEFCKHYFGDDFIIGVHYRGTDKLEVDPVPYNTVTQHIRTVMAQHPDMHIKIFVATDDARFATYIQEQFPGRVIMRDALRSDNAIGVHMRPDLVPYQKGEDALIDCLLLSRCSLLIKMASNLSDCSLQFNHRIPVIRLNKSFSE